MIFQEGHGSYARDDSGRLEIERLCRDRLAGEGSFGVVPVDRIVMNVLVVETHEFTNIPQLVHTKGKCSNGPHHCDHNPFFSSRRMVLLLYIRMKVLTN